MRRVGNGTLGVLLAIFALGSVAFGQEKGSESSSRPRRLKVEADFAVFGGDAEHSYLEVYYGVNQEGLTFVPGSAGSLEAAALVRLNLWHADSLWAADIWKMPSTVSDSSEIGLHNMVDALRFPVVPGEYVLKLYATDANDRANNDSSLVDLRVEPSAAGEIALSQLELASSITKSPDSTSGPFYKNTLEVIPNPGSLFGDERPMLFYYCEAYNLPQGLSGETYSTRCLVSDAQGKPLDAVKPRERTKKVIPSSVEVGTVNVSTLPTGVYFLNFAILDDSNAPLKQVSKKFYVFNPKVDQAQSQHALGEEVAASVFAGMTEPELDQEYDRLQYILSDNEKRFWEKLQTLDAKRSFLYSFWRARDTDPNTVVNEMRQAYLQRVEYANENFRSFSRDGWRTDRGRVYIVYGPPDDIDFTPSSEDMPPYQTWYYNDVQGGVKFIFVDREGYREYTLVHSDALGEMQNPDWESWVRVIR
jgi:GWxTD domain-containing protein